MCTFSDKRPLDPKVDGPVQYHPGPRVSKFRPPAPLLIGQSAWWRRAKTYWRLASENTERVLAWGPLSYCFKWRAILLTILNAKLVEEAVANILVLWICFFTARVARSISRENTKWPMEHSLQTNYWKSTRIQMITDQTAPWKAHVSGMY